MASGLSSKTGLSYGASLYRQVASLWSGTSGLVQSFGSSVSPPVNTVAPAITGTIAVGSVATCSTGTWTNSPSSYNYNWKVAGISVQSSATNTYTPVPTPGSGDANKALTCVVTATNAGGSTDASPASTSPRSVIYYLATQNIITAMTGAGSTPSTARQDLMNTFVASMKVGALSGHDIWAKMDRVWFPAAESTTQGQFDWITAASTITEPVVGTWTVDRGWKGNGTTSYLNTVYNPFSGATNYSQNSASIGIYVNANTATNGNYDYGCTNAAVSFNVSLALTVRSNKSSTDTATTTATNGLAGWSRSGPSAYDVMRDTTATAATTASAAVINSPFLLGTRNNISDGTVSPAAGFTTRQIAFVFAGGVLTTGTNSEWTDMYNAVSTYLTALGAN